MGKIPHAIRSDPGFGPRAQTDQVALAEATEYTTALTVTAGIGTSLAVADCARLAARTASTVAAETGDPAIGLRVAREALEHAYLRSLTTAAPTCSILTAVWSIGSHRIDIAWAGQCAAYALPYNRPVRLLTATTPPAAGQFDPASQHARTGLFAVLRMNPAATQTRRLLLATPGLVAALDLTRIREVLEDTATVAEAADQLIAAALKAGAGNITAAVINPSPGWDIDDTADMAAPAPEPAAAAPQPGGCICTEWWQCPRHPSSTSSSTADAVDAAALLGSYADEAAYQTSAVTAATVTAGQLLASDANGQAIPYAS